MNVANEGNDKLCDDNNDIESDQSPDWHGPSWYRIMGQAGTKIPENPVDSEHCHTHTTGWLNGEHPTIVGETIVSEVCFNLQGDKCWRSSEIQIKHCGGYFLYYLKNTPGCNLRYCSE